jgi:hypothetical protein
MQYIRADARRQSRADERVIGAIMSVNQISPGLGFSLGLLVLALLSGSVFSSPRTSRLSPPTPGPVSMNAAAWNILYSPSMPAHPDVANGGWYFDFPSCGGSSTCSVNYVTVPVNLAATESVRAVVRIATSGSPVFHYKLSAKNTCESPAHVRFILQRKSDDLSARSEFYRWFSSSGVKLEEGSADLTVPMAPDQWVSVFGKRGNHDEAAGSGFQQALGNLGNVGFVFGGGCFYGHGVNVIGGSARFLATSYSVK